jgi:hypothetical protein
MTVREIYALNRDLPVFEPLAAGTSLLIRRKCTDKAMCALYHTCSLDPNPKVLDKISFDPPDHILRFGAWY